jgi:hypothetical protein
MKLIIIICAMDMDSNNTIDESHVLLANTLLSHAEQSMPLALGEFGKARGSDVAHSILQFVYNRGTQITTTADVWQHFSQDIESPGIMSDIMMKLSSSNKIQVASINMGGTRVHGFLPSRRAIDEEGSSTKYVDYSLLTQEEREMKK